MDALETLSKNLNPLQREAMQTLSGPLLILAGAGSGKTRVLTVRTANLIAQGFATPLEIMAVTFTNKAAKEMETRILSLLRELEIPVHGRMWISTFHSICARILREHIHLLDYKPFFGIYDSGDQLSLLKKVLIALNIDDKSHPAKAFQSSINHAKTEGWVPQDLLGRRHQFNEMTVKVYERYEQDMKRANALDFADLLLKTYILFCDYPAILENYQERFRYLMIDEYQDTNRIQYLLIQKIASKHHNLCVVGDEDQSIYSWRGADISNILNFEQDFPECKVIKLEQNYRSSQTIVSAASHVIRNNTERKDKTLFTENDPGEPISVREEENEYDEARFVVKEIEVLMNDSHLNYSDIAIFYRTNAQSRVLEEQLRSHNIPYKIVGGVGFYERMEIKDMLAYMKLAINPTDDLSLKRIINVPTRGIGKTTIDRIDDFAASRNLSLIEALSAMIESREFNAGTTRKLREFLNIIEEVTVASKTRPLNELYHTILDRTAYVHRLKEDDTPESESRIENLEEFDNAISKFIEERGDEATLQTFLEEMSLISDVDSLKEEAKSITLMTLHISKGLEYPVVYIVGLEEGLFPSGRATDSDSPSAIEEERRLCYVGMTRAEKRLTLTYARTRKVWGTDQYNAPSRFLKEIPEEYVRNSTAVGRPRFMQSRFSDPERAARFGFTSDSNQASEISSYKKHPLMGADAASGGVPRYEDFGDTDFETESAQLDFKKGQRVRHPSYGVGSIFQVEGGGPEMKVSVVFGDNTVKKFVVKYARLERV
jgi:DNA helicase-2/ATP-dependent DNA helicase PcrA